MKALMFAALLIMPVVAWSAETSDAAFLRQVAQAGMAEVELGKMAMERAEKDTTRDFGKLMVQDHTEAARQLKAVAARKHVTLPTDLGTTGKKDQSELKLLNGEAFDSAYLRTQVMAHDRTVDLLEKQIASGTDEDIKGWARKTLPTVKQHAQMATTLAGGTDHEG